MLYLVVQSTPIGNLETAVEQMREERITGLIADYESPVHYVCISSSF